MLLNRALSILPVALLAACTGTGELVSSNIRIDRTDAESGVDSEQPAMCVDSEGTVFVVWVDDRDGTPGIWMNRSTDRGATWGGGALKLNVGSGAASEPDIDCTDAGVFVVWKDDSDSELEYGNIYYQRTRDKGLTWLSRPLLIEDDPDGNSNSREPKIRAVGSKVYVTWADSKRGSYDIFAAASHDGEVFFDPVRVDSTDDPGASYSANPQLEADGQGNVYVLWEDTRNGKADVYFASSVDDGLSFGPDIRIDVGDQPGQFDSFSPSFAAKGSRIYVVWSDERNGDKRDILMNWSPNRGLTWATQAIRVESSPLGTYNARFPSVALDDEGGAYVAWEDARSGGYDVFLRKAVDSDFIEPEVRMDGDGQGSGNSLRPIVLVDEEMVVTAWEDFRADRSVEGYNDLYYRGSFSLMDDLSDDDDGVREKRIDSLVAASSFKVDLDVHLQGGELFSVWVDGRRGDSDIYFQRLAVGEQAEFIRVRSGQ